MLNSRIEAIEVTNKVINKLTPEKAYQIFIEECEAQIDMLNTYIWNEYNVGGWYYNTESNDFCGDIIRKTYIDKSIEYSKTKAINKL